MSALHDLPWEVLKVFGVCIYIIEDCNDHVREDGSSGVITSNSGCSSAGLSTEERHSWLEELGRVNNAHYLTHGAWGYYL